MRDNENRIWLTTIITSVIFAALWLVFAVTHYNGTLFHDSMNANLLAFVVFVLFYMVCFFGMDIILRFIHKKNVSDKTTRYIEAIISAAVLACMIWTYFIEENLWPEGAASIYLRHKISWAVYFCILCIVYMIFRKVNKSIFTGKWGRIFLGVFIAIVTAVAQYSPNAFLDEGGHIYHYDAYTNSIFNVLHLKAFSDVNLSIYGHYGIIYYPFVKILGGDTIAVARAISIIAFITIFALILVIEKIIKNDKVFVITALAIPGTCIMLYVTGVYDQIAPHRYLFPALLFLFCSRIRTNKEEDKWQRIEIAGWIICILAILWNTECGLFCAIGYSAFLFYGTLDHVKHIDKHVIARFITICICDVLVFICAIGVADLYNICVGGQFIGIKDFIYPLMSQSYEINDLLGKIPSGPNIYIFEMILFLALGCISVAKLPLFAKSNEEEQEDDTRALILMIAVIGLCCFTYYINRPAYCNISISHVEAILLLGMVADRYNKHNTFNVRTVSEIVLVAIAIGTVSHIGMNISIKADSSWNVAALEEAVEPIGVEVPEDTYAFGSGIHLIYSMLDRDPQSATIDFEDMNPQTIVYLTEELQKQDSFLAEEDCLAALTEFDMGEYEAVKTYDVLGKKYSYYVRENVQ